MRRIIVLDLINSSGVLNRITGMLTKRNFNIHSITGGPSESGTTKMTVVVDIPRSLGAEQLTKQLNKLIDVLKVTDITEESFVERELGMFKVNVSRKERSEIEAIVRPFRARVLDISNDSMIIEVTGVPSKIDAFFDLIKPYGIEAESRTGITAFTRG